MKQHSPIIIIEDDADDQFFITDICESLKLSHKLKFFSDAERAFGYLKSTTDQPFLILCDINLPGMSGIDLRKLINGNDALRRKSIPFVFYSTATTKGQVNQAYDMAVQGFFVKEHSVKETKATLSTIFKYWERCVHPNSLG